jgi:hypothetical protein
MIDFIKNIKNLPDSKIEELIEINLKRISSGHDIKKVFPPAYFGAVEKDLLDLIPQEYIPTKEDFPNAFEMYENFKKLGV